jgi:hypothetical protein
LNGAAARAGLPIAPSRLGFGCASLGSRIAGPAGLNALSEAFDAGVNWFDVAPAYGAGEAETLLGKFLRGRRDRAIVVTKVGLAPPERLGLLKLAYALGRPFAACASSLRRGFRGLAATRNRHLPLTAELIERSIAQSLRRLGVETVDVYALHDPNVADVGRDDVRRALERVCARGQARMIAVAGRRDACCAALEVGAPYSMLQTSVEDLANSAAAFATSGPLLSVIRCLASAAAALANSRPRSRARPSAIAASSPRAITPSLPARPPTCCSIARSRPIPTAWCWPRCSAPATAPPISPASIA